MGPIDFKRRYYFVANPDTGKKEIVYLLDKKIELSLIGRFTKRFADLCAETVAEESYYETAKTVSKATGDVISAQGVWNVIKGLGEKFKEDEDDAPAEKKK
jgi:hypothetical protein